MTASRTPPCLDYPDDLLTLADGARIEPPLPFGHYLLHAVVRRSNMSLVLLATRVGSDERVAVKICLPGADRNRFEQETQLGLRIREPGILRIDPRDAGRTKDGYPWHATRWLDGPKLDAFLADPARTAEEKLEVMDALCRIVGGLHTKEGIAHRDLKPSNVIVEGGWQPVVLDFGLAHVTGSASDRSGLTGSGQHVGGTPGYFPPWSLDGGALTDAQKKRWDVYSLGVITVEALTGVRPARYDDPRFTSDGVRRLLQQKVPNDRRFDALLADCLSADPNRGPRDAAELHRLFRRCRGLSQGGGFRRMLARTAVGLFVTGLVLAMSVQALLVVAPAEVEQAWAWFQEKAVEVVGKKSEPEPGVEGSKVEPQPAVIIPNPSRTNVVGVSLQVSPTGATVRLLDHRANGVVLWERPVPDSGRIEVPVPEDPTGDFGLLVFLAGYQPNHQVVRPDSGSISVSLDRLRGEVLLKTTPGATVILTGSNGEARSVGPVPADGTLLVQSLEEGDWAWRLELADHEAASGRITGLVQGRRQTVERTLKPLPGRLSVAGHPTMEIWEGSSRLGTANAWISMTPGTHELQLRRAGFRPQTLAVTLPPNRDLSRTAGEWVAENGAIRLVIDLAETARTFFAAASKRLFLDEVEVPVATFPHVQRDLNAGAHTLRLQVEGFAPAESGKVVVIDGQTNDVPLALRPLPAFLAVYATPTDARVTLVGTNRTVNSGERFEVPALESFSIEVTALEHQSTRVTFQPVEPGRDYRHEMKLERSGPSLRELPKDLIAVVDAKPAPLDGLYEGSREAQARQIVAAQTAGLPLEVRLKDFDAAFRYIPAGTFTRGSPETEAGRDSDETAHQVTLRSGYYLGKYEVTRRFWRWIMGNDPSHFQNGSLDAPVETVSWEDVQQFLERLCDKVGVARGTYRLPTEAEWEYACRAGTTGPTYGPLDEIAWYEKNSGASTHAVGGKKPNAFGLYDMSGNCGEWCSDGFGAYPRGSVENPGGLGSGAFRVFRGGGWWSPAVYCRSAIRNWSAPGYRGRNLGFRLVRTAL